MLAGLLDSAYAGEIKSSKSSIHPILFNRRLKTPYCVAGFSICMEGSRLEVRSGASKLFPEYASRRNVEMYRILPRH